MLELSQLIVSIHEKLIIASPFSYTFSQGQVVAILGHNGSGKSSLAATIMGHPRYHLDSGEIFFNGENITHLPPDNRAERGIFLSFQNVPEIPGIRLLEYLRAIYIEQFKRLHPEEKPPTPFVFRRMIEKLLPTYGLDSSFLDRDLYVGFSGGEKRRIEMLQIELLEPSLIILDEIDSGLDIDAIGILRQKIDIWRSMSKTIIIITHNFHLLDDIDADRVVLMNSGQYITDGDIQLIQTIKKDGFDALISTSGTKQ